MAPRTGTYLFSVGDDLNSIWPCAITVDTGRK